MIRKLTTAIRRWMELARVRSGTSRTLTESLDILAARGDVP